MRCDPEVRRKHKPEDRRYGQLAIRRVPGRRLDVEAGLSDN
jgi:hypothetical protein